MAKTINQMAKEVKTNSFIPSFSTVLNEVGETFYKRGAYAVINRLERIIQSNDNPAVAYPKIVETINELKGEAPVALKEIQFIDLGLSSGTLWADHNLGADAPEKAGDYYRFGETKPFIMHSPNYVFDMIGGCIAGTDRDAATIKLGKKYNMPSVEQFKELFNECKCKWIKLNGVRGMKLTGPNGKKIFLPASNFRECGYGRLHSNAPRGFYWTATPRNCGYSCFLYFEQKGWKLRDEWRSYGYNIRPVKNNNVQYQEP